MKSLGLTGGIACGKSSVARLLKGQGLAVIDADQVARNIVAKGQPALQEICASFGANLLLENGELNRLAMRQLIIDDPQAKKTLEQITHPKIFLAIHQWEQDQKNTGVPATVVEAALMVETGSYQRYDALIVVTCHPEQQIQRLMARNEISRQQAENWIATQMPMSEKEKVADWLIDNSTTFEDLQQQLNNGLPALLTP